MDSSEGCVSMSLLIFLFIFAPLAMLLHECGHGLGALFVKAKEIKITHGTGPSIVTLSIGRLQYRLHLFYFLGGMTESEKESPYNRLEKITITLMGPIFNGIIGIFVFYFISSENQLLQLFVLFNFWLCFVNLIPFKIGERKSDGYLVFCLLFRKNFMNT